MTATATSIVVLVAAGLCACSVSQEQQAQQAPKVTEKAFGSGGRIEMQLSGGSYTIRPAADDRVRVTLSGNVSNAATDLMTNGTHATLAVKDSPKTNFHGVIEVPKAADLVIRLSGGDLEIAAISGNKDIETGGGNVEIAVGDPKDYSHVDASVKAGNLEAGVFGESRSGLFPHFEWSGPGKYTLHVNLGAGNLELRAK